MECEEGERVLADFREYAASVLGYPVDFTGPLTAHEIAELGAGIVSFPPRPPERPTTSVSLPPMPTEMAEDEAVILNQTRMRGIVQPPKTASAAPKQPVRRTPTKRVAHDAEILAAEMPPIGWEFGPIAVLDDVCRPPKKPRPSVGLPPSEDAYYVSELEQQSPEYRAWAARMLETVTREYCVGGIIREVRAPVVEVAEQFPVQNVGSSRVFTSVVRANAALKAKVREEIRAGGLQTAHFRSLGDVCSTRPRQKPGWDIDNLGRFPLPEPRNPVNDGRYALFMHSDLTPPRRCLVHDATMFTGFLPDTAPTNEDKSALQLCRSLLPVTFPVARVNNDKEHPGLAPVRGFELWADSPAGRSLAAVSDCTDFLVTKSGRIIGAIDCVVTLGQTVPKTENLNEGALRQAAELAYHNAILPVFFPDPRGSAVPVKLSSLLVPWTPFKSLMARSRCLAIIEAIAERDKSKRYCIREYLGPIRPKTLTRGQLMELQAVRDFVSARRDLPYMRASDPRLYGTSVHGYLKGKCYLQVGGMAASSFMSISPLTLPIKAPVAEAVKLGDSVPRKRDGNGNLLLRFPKRKTPQEEADDRLQGTQDDQRTFDRTKRIELAEQALKSGRLTKEEARKVRIALVKLKANRPQSNEDRWTLINIVCPRTKTNQGTVREDGLRHALHRSQWYAAAVFRALIRGRDCTKVEYPRDCRPVEPGHRIEFCDWSSNPKYVRHVGLRIQWPGRPELTLQSRSDDGILSKLTPEERVVAIWAVYLRLSIRNKRRVRAELQANCFVYDVTGSVQMVDEQIEELRRRIRGLTGLSSAFLRSLCR